MFFAAPFYIIRIFKYRIKIGKIFKKSNSMKRILKRIRFKMKKKNLNVRKSMNTSIPDQMSQKIGI